MFKMIDEDENFEGYGYRGSDGYFIFTELSANKMILRDCDLDRISEVPVDDIPKLILALQGVYDHAKGKK